MGSIGWRPEPAFRIPGLREVEVIPHDLVGSDGLGLSAQLGQRLTPDEIAGTDIVQRQVIVHLV